MVAIVRIAESDPTAPSTVCDGPPAGDVREVRPVGPPRYAFDPAAAPVARVRPGEVVAIETADCFGGRLVSEAQRPSEVLGPRLNPVTGPLFVEGAAPGDALVVRVHSIDATRDWAVSCLLPGCGLLAEPPAVAGPWAGVGERIWVYRRTAGGFARGGALEIPWAPFFGTIGVAPPFEPVASEEPGPHGGNLDAPLLGPGAALVLPVFHEGALFSVGDAHAAQGQGEVGGPALEIAARGLFSFDVIAEGAPSWPRFETAEAVAAVGVGTPMEAAARAAVGELVRWLASGCGLDPVEAVQLLTLVGGLAVASMVNREHTVVASCPKRFLPEPAGGWLVAPAPESAAASGQPGSPGPADVRAAPQVRSRPLPVGERPWFVG